MKFSRFFLLCFLLFLCGCAHEATPSKADATQLRVAMKDSAEYLARACKPSGEFVYLAGLKPGKDYGTEYNVLRHAGALYVLSEYSVDYPDPKIKAALVRAANFLKRKYMRPIEGEDNLMAIWELPTDSKGAQREVKLGGIGLGLVGLIGTEKIAPGTTSMKTFRQLGNCILWLQEKDGSFYSKYDPAKGGKQGKWESLYYPGEAALGLAALAEIETDPKQKARWINAALHGIAYLAREREHTKNVPLDHWILLATAQLWPLHVYSDQSVSKALLLQHAVQICTALANDSALRGVRTTPIATRLEGMQAALTFLPPDQQELRDLIRTETERGIPFLMKAQASQGAMKGAIPHAYTAPGNPPVDDRADDVRIDYIQHTLSAWLEYSRQHKN